MPQAVSLYHQPGLPAIVRDYLMLKPELLGFAEDHPAQANFLALYGKRDFDDASRKTLVQAIQTQYGEDLGAETLRALQKLSRRETRTIVTGHQLCLAGGPLYFAVKIAQTIALAKKLENEAPGVSLVPVFWMASEDHDREEVNHVEVFGKKFIWPVQASGAAGRFTTYGMRDTLLQALELLQREPGYSEVLDIVENYCAQPDLSSATRYLVNRLFGEYGLLVVNGDDPSLKRMFAAVMERELIEKVAAPAVEQASALLRDLGYHTQINAREINLFLLHDQQRSRIIASGDGFGLADSEWKTDRDTMLNDVRVHPERFSPNVVLRPLYQETILPNLAVILGPGELSYWLQLKEVFKRFGCPFPVLVPRDSFYPLDHSLRERMARLGLEAGDFLEPEAQLIKKWLEKQHPVQFRDIREKWQTLVEEAAGRAATVDESLRSAFLAEGSRQLAAWQLLEKKLEKSLKNRETESLNRIKSIQDKLLPGGVPLERREALLRYLAQYGSDFVKDLVHNAGSASTPSVWFWWPEL